MHFSKHLLIWLAALVVFSPMFLYAGGEPTKAASQIADVLWSVDNLIPLGCASFRKDTLEPMIKKGLPAEAADETELALKRFLKELSTKNDVRQSLALALDEVFSEQELSQVAVKAPSAKEMVEFTSKPEFLQKLNDVMTVAFEEYGATFRAEVTEILRKYVKPKASS